MKLTMKAIQAVDTTKIKLAGTPPRTPSSATTEPTSRAPSSLPPRREYHPRWKGAPQHEPAAHARVGSTPS
eukprot:6735629-Prymnesium_polylepis.1